MGGPKNTVILWGDWKEKHQSNGSNNMKYHAPTANAALRRAFMRHGYRIWFVAEPLTSKRCFGCCGQGECATFREVRTFFAHNVVADTPSVIVQ